MFGHLFTIDHHIKKDQVKGILGSHLMAMIIGSIIGILSGIWFF